VTASTIARRLKRLEQVIIDPTGERQRRVAEGTCPDCGYEHGYLPTHGGNWRCVVCGRRFVLEPGPTCNQPCASCHALQRPRPPAPGHEAWFAERRSRRAIDDLCESMAPEHVALVRRWLGEHCTRGEDLRLSEGGWYALLNGLKPPALVRAFWVLISHHVETRLSVSLAPAVAEVYLSDPDAWPAAGCDGCGYLLPAHVKLHPDDTYEYVGVVYGGTCPICGLTDDSLIR